MFLKHLIDRTNLDKHSYRIFSLTLFSQELLWMISKSLTFVYELKCYKLNLNESGVVGISLCRNSKEPMMMCVKFWSAKYIFCFNISRMKIESKIKQFSTSQLIGLVESIGLIPVEVIRFQISLAIPFCSSLMNSRS